MKQDFKRTFTALLLLLSVSALDGQTYFSLRLSGGLTDINKGAFFQGDPATTTYNWNFENQVVEHWAFGLMVEHQLDEKLFLAWTNTYYPNRVFEVYCNGVAPCNFFRFDSWRTDLAVKRSFADAVLLGMGLGLNYIHNPEIGRYSSGNYSKVSLNTFNGAYFEYTAQMSLAYWYKRYMIEVAYFKGFGHRGIDREMLRPINELNLTLILQFKAPWSGKGRRGMELRF
ncbi:MAG: hypothetical protein NXI26_25890 [bacterium]|uniref:Outer membrane protein beta-barrel domain-containing protein n=2 Tax=Phaeodactylibacter xiamenensis TaxID=1524460 RepID=A0A098S8Z0_9BACT|nr:hypothetical protein [Phaeodactylibacter xiamenensis]KGE87552.1 hypothetical protein IX84_15225 [Phaeodactylibacter xiamenensis]MCR9055304.1 hypothetical protein [bacterium]